MKWRDGYWFLVFGVSLALIEFWRVAYIDRPGARDWTTPTAADVLLARGYYIAPRYGAEQRVLMLRDAEGSQHRFVCAPNTPPRYADCFAKEHRALTEGQLIEVRYFVAPRDFDGREVLGGKVLLGLAADRRTLIDVNNRLAELHEAAEAEDASDRADVPVLLILLGFVLVGAGAVALVRVKDRGIAPHAS